MRGGRRNCFKIINGGWERYQQTVCMGVGGWSGRMDGMDVWSAPCVQLQCKFRKATNEVGTKFKRGLRLARVSQNTVQAKKASM